MPVNVVHPPAHTRVQSRAYLDQIADPIINCHSSSGERNIDRRAIEIRDMYRDYAQGGIDMYDITDHAPPFPIYDPTSVACFHAAERHEELARFQYRAGERRSYFNERGVGRSVRLQRLEAVVVVKKWTLLPQRKFMLGRHDSFVSQIPRWHIHNEKSMPVVSTVEPEKLTRIAR
jgi:hypothetical protein